MKIEQPIQWTKCRNENHWSERLLYKECRVCGEGDTEDSYSHAVEGEKLYE